MRKLLLFLLVFGLGLVAVLVLQRRGQRKDERGPEPGREDTPAPDVPPSQGATPGSVSGQFGIELFDEITKFRQYKFAAHLEHQGGGRYLATGVEMTMFDSRQGELLQTVNAERGRLRIEFAANEPRIGDGGSIALEEVVIVRVSGSPFVPLEVRSPSFDGSLETRILRSGPGDLVDVEGRGITGRGRGFTLQEQANEIRFERAGEVELELAGGARARFATTGLGPIWITRTDEATERYELHASEGATIAFWEAGLDPKGEPSFSVDASSIDLAGRREAGAFVLESAQADGEFEARRGADRYGGERALATFGADGNPERIEVEGAPRGNLWLDTAREVPVEIVTRGEGKLDVHLADRATFTQRGPAELTIPAYDVRLTAEEALGGDVAQDESAADFSARGNVRLLQLDRVLETDELTGSITAEGEGTLTAAGIGRTHLVAHDEAGDLVDLVSQGRLEFESVGGAWKVPLAEEVTLTREGADAFQAHAARVVDLDGTTQSFLVEGDVTYRSELGHGRAVRAIATGPDHVQLVGLPGDPASFFVGPDVPGAPEAASFEAEEIDVLPDRLEARRGVRTIVHSIDRDYRLLSQFVRLTVEPRDESIGTRAFTLECEEVDEARMSSEGQETTCSAKSLVATGVLREKNEPARRIEASRVTATGRVEVRHTGELELAGAGELFTLDADGKGRLETKDDKRVSAWGRFADSSLPYEMTATYVEFDPTTLQSADPRIYIDATLLPVLPRGVAEPGFTEASGDTLRVEGTAVWLLGHAHVEGVDRTGSKLVLDASTIRLDGDLDRAKELDENRWIRAIEATGGFQATYDDQGIASGDSFLFTRERAVLHGNPAHFALGGMHVTSAQIDVDLVAFLVTTKSGALWSEVGDSPWRVEFASMQPIPRGTETLFVLREPSIVQGETSARAAWAVAWIDVLVWARRGNEVLWGRPKEGEEPELPKPRMPERDLVENPFRRIVNEEVGRFVEKLYLEGDVEILEGEERSARADALLVDLREHTGYMQNAEVVTSIDVFGDRERVRTRAANLRMTANGSLHAKKATLTSCDYAEPHYVVQTGQLSLDPRPDGTWTISAKKNLLRFGEGVQLPLPGIGGLVLDDDGDIKGFETSTGEVWGVETVGVGDSGRFGTEVKTGFRTEAGNVGLGVGKLAGFKGRTVRGRWKYDGSYLGSRGVLLGVGLELRERDPAKAPDQQAWLNLYASGVSDSGEDRGYVRVDEADRDSYRAWYRARGRYPLSRTEWIDVALTYQTDPGVQSEFFERLYTRFEQRDNELHYRRAEGSDYFQASVKARLEEFRTDVEELPSAGYYHGATPIGRAGPLEFDYSGAIDVAYLRRRQGTIGNPSAAQQIEGFTEFSEEVFTDGLGDREAARIDSQHELFSPFQLGFSGLRARPFLEAQLTAWDRGVDEENQPSRAGFFGGAEVATTFWKRTSSSLTSVTPSARVSEEIEIFDSGGDPVRFDSIDDPIDGDQTEVGLRTRWEKLEEPRMVDLDLRSIRRTDRTEGAEDMQLFAALADIRTPVFELPFAMRVDYRFDVDNSETEYSRSAMGISPLEDLQVELAYTRGPIVHDPILAAALRQEVNDPRFEAISGKVRLRLTPKWEVEVSQTYSLTDDGRLDAELTLRRFGHDFLMELGIGTRSGEGASFGIALVPLAGWRPKRLGLLE